MSVEIVDTPRPAIEDKRYRKSREKLASAIVKLARSRDYDSLTVREIAKEAGIGYRTFYRHYTDKDELILSVMQETLKRQAGLLIDPGGLIPDSPNSRRGHRENSRTLFLQLEQHKDLYRFLFGSSIRIVREIEAFATKQAMEAIRPMVLTENPDIPLDILAYHLASSSMGFMRWWLKTENKYTADIMGDLLYSIVFEPLLPLVNGLNL